ncbi:MAG: SUMF1/EgtB/PvdO family nonheme iron enzyme [Phycisphaerales bacterium]
MAIARWIVMWTVASVTASTSVLAQTPPSYGLDFVTIGAPGNRATIPSEVPLTPSLKIGAVDYDYRIMRTEVTVSDWLGFVNAYAPHWSGTPTNLELTGFWINLTPNGYQIVPGTEGYAANTSWRMAARYTNWLHNGRVNEPWAFENGAYDSSTFTTTPQGYHNDQEAHHPDARFWLPTIDEWVKGMHYDPDRYGPGQEGYWSSQAGMQGYLISGYPWEGGQTSAMIKGLFGDFPVGLYPDVQSPWGLLEGSGGGSEWSETIWDPIFRTRMVDGSHAGGTISWDRLDLISSADPRDITWGFRVASQVPTPTVLASLVLFAAAWPRRRA